MKKFIFICLVFTINYSCRPNENWREEATFNWYARKVNNVFIAIGYRTDITWYGNSYTEKHDLDGDSVSSNSFFLAVLTSNYDPRSHQDTIISMPIKFNSHMSPYFDERNANIEQQIQRDYDKNISHPNGKGLSYDFFIDAEYRLTEITNLKLLTLNTRLFGKDAGESLNDFFDIIVYNLPVIFTAPTERLVYGCGSTDMPTSIDEWLSLQPLAQETMWFTPNIAVPEKLPLNVQFVVEMTTKEGAVLRDTTKMVTITK